MKKHTESSILTKQHTFAKIIAPQPPKGGLLVRESHPDLSPPSGDFGGAYKRTYTRAFGALLFSSLMLSSCIERNNPLDFEGTAYIKPNCTISGIPADGVLRTDALAITCAGISESQKYRFKIDGDEWTQWRNGSFSKNLADTYHELTVQTIYPSAKDTGEQTISFSSLSSDNSVYFTPAYLKADSAVTLSVLNLQGSATAMHLVLHGAEAASAVPAGDTAFTKIFVKDSIVDISVYPGGKEISGSREIAKITLKNVHAGTVNFDLTAETKDGKPVTVTGFVGTRVKQEKK